MDVSKLQEQSNEFNLIEILVKIKFGMGEITTTDHLLLLEFISDITGIVDTLLQLTPNNTFALEATTLLNWRKLYHAIQVITKD